MAAKQTASARRPPGSLRLVSKTAKGNTYRRWQWRTHRRTDTGWQTVDLEIGAELTGMRARVLVALGDLKAPLLVERWARWHFRAWPDLPSWTGRPAAARELQRSAWWIELPRQSDDPVRLRFRSLDGAADYRRGRPAIRQAEEVASSIWQSLNDDPVIELARLQWQEREAQRVVDEIEQEQIELRRMRRRGEINQRDYEADERSTYLRSEWFQEVIGRSAERYDLLLSEVVAAMPRPTRDNYRSRVLALVDRWLNDPKQQQRWRADQWDGNTLNWRT